MKTINELIQNIVGGASAAHAYIIEDERADARAGFIKTLAQGLECTAEAIDERPCGRCDACRQVDAETSLDIVHMQMSGKTSYKVKEDVEPFIERLDMGAYGNFLVGIIDDADSLSEIAQNKLLKTLEEPRESVILLLGISNSERLLSTVRSRSSVIRAANFEGYEAEEGEPANEELQKAASMMLGAESAFYEVRAAIEKNVKSKGDAFMLLDALEDVLEERMRSGEDFDACATMIEISEKARMDIERDMDKNKALKRLVLELQRVQ